ncbi:hypothetical protein EVAR_75663_1 [Eumeta japonica]|uniref:Uncharacterized protein n=1 Tax=Eumeta variegata TaxID=151549 RepID=A0A4C1U023_EUMVA|nr:hypothetical protein EVAR_75663_1 [Eumeta japonica]
MNSAFQITPYTSINLLQVNLGFAIVCGNYLPFDHDLFGRNQINTEARINERLIEVIYLAATKEEVASRRRALGPITARRD